MDISERLHKLMLRPGFQMRSEQETILEGMKEIKRLRSVIRDAAEAIERQSTTAPVLESLRAALNH